MGRPRRRSFGCLIACSCSEACRILAAKPSIRGSRAYAAYVCSDGQNLLLFLHEISAIAPRGRDDNGWRRGTGLPTPSARMPHICVSLYGSPSQRRDAGSQLFVGCTLCRDSYQPLTTGDRPWRGYPPRGYTMILAPETPKINIFKPRDLFH